MLRIFLATMTVFCVGTQHAGAQQCPLTDISIDSLAIAPAGLISTRIRGRLTNACPLPTGPQIKFIFTGRNGELLRVEDMWPASVNNIAARSDYPFEFSIESIPGLIKVEARVIATRRW